MKYVGMDMRLAVNLLKEFGASVDIAHKTGEYIIVHPEAGRVRVNCRRRDAPRSLSVYLKRLSDIVSRRAILSTANQTIFQKKMALAAAVSPDLFDSVKIPKKEKEPLENPPESVGSSRPFANLKIGGVTPEVAKTKPIVKQPPKQVKLAQPGLDTGAQTSQPQPKPGRVEVLEYRPIPQPETVLPPVIDEPQPLATYSGEDYVANPPIESPKVELPPVKIEAPAVPTDLNSQLKFFRQMKEQIEQKGISRLRQLQDDRKGIIDMLQDTDREIQTIINDLQEAGVSIPNDLVLSQFTSAPKSNAISRIERIETPIQPNDDSGTIFAPSTTTGMPAMSTSTEGATWDGPAWTPEPEPEKTVSMSVRVAEFMEANDEMWLLGREILDAVGISETVQPANVLNRLIDSGKLEKRGQHRYTQYHWKSDQK